MSLCCVDDRVGIQFIEQEISNIVSSRPNAKAYKVKSLNNKIIEKEIQTNYLGNL